MHTDLVELIDSLILSSDGMLASNYLEQKMQRSLMRVLKTLFERAYV